MIFNPENTNELVRNGWDIKILDANKENLEAFTTMVMQGAEGTFVSACYAGFDRSLRIAKFALKHENYLTRLNLDEGFELCGFPICDLNPQIVDGAVTLTGEITNSLYIGLNITDSIPNQYSLMEFIQKLAEIKGDPLSLTESFRIVILNGNEESIADMLGDI